MSGAAPFIEFRGVSKRFGDCIANTNVSFSIRQGTIHAVVGENGAGKSTIMKILFGLYGADQGQILLEGHPIAIDSPAVAKHLGIGMVHQHFMLAGPLPAVDHVILESEKLREPRFLWQPLDRVTISKELDKLSSELQMPVPWLEPVERLPVGIQQRIEILKLLYNDSRILILDEPTAVLTPLEVQEFLQRLLKIKAQGKTIILITHKLKEVFAVADDITIFRKGTVVGTGPVSSWTPQSLSQQMVGESLLELKISGQPNSFKGQKVLQVKSETSFNLTVERGEIVGIAGVEGNGQSELIQTIMNPRAISTRFLDDVQVAGISVLGKSNFQIRRMGVGYLPEDRHSKAVSLNSSLLENFLLGQHFRFGKIIQRAALLAAFQKVIEKFDVKFQHPRQMLKDLSGGNQQKLVVGRELGRDLKLVVAAHPTRGVDIQAIQKIHQALLSAREHGTGMLLISSELDELMKLSDRILVLYRGRIQREFIRGEFDEKKIGAAMGGIET